VYFWIGDPENGAVNVRSDLAVLRLSTWRFGRPAPAATAA
jgi:hypothetical protein